VKNKFLNEKSWARISDFEIDLEGVGRVGD
jgi:hypothetical protein